MAIEIEKTFDVPQPLEEVWGFLTDPDEEKLVDVDKSELGIPDRDLDLPDEPEIDRARPSPGCRAFGVAGGSQFILSDG